LGYNSGTPVSEDYTSRGSQFTGKVNWVQLDADPDDFDHLISPEERLRVATPSHRRQPELRGAWSARTRSNAT
jgi:hypothetical protein